MKTASRHPLLAPMVLATVVLLTGADTAVKYEHYDDYFGSGGMDRGKDFACMAIVSREDFDSRFKVGHFGFGDGNNAPTALAPDAFQAGMVVAVVRQGQALWRYEVERLSADGEKLTLRYKAKREARSFTLACPLVILLPRGAYSSVTFIEDGKEVGRAVIKDPGKP